MIPSRSPQSIDVEGVGGGTKGVVVEKREAVDVLGRG